VDDELDIRDLLEYNLTRAGFGVSLACNGSEALKVIEAATPDLIVLDVMMPGLDGLETCRRIRDDVRMRLIPVIMLTAKSGESAQVQGLSAGADIYFTKPIANAVLVEQIHALLRGVERFVEGPDVVSIDDLIIDRGRYTVFRREGERAIPMHFPRQQFELIHFLASHPGWCFTRQELLDRLWSSDELIARTVDVHVRKIRARLGGEYIETVKGIGYRYRDSRSVNVA